MRLCGCRAGFDIRLLGEQRDRQNEDIKRETGWQPCGHLILEDGQSVVYTLILTDGTEIELMRVQLSK